MLFKRTVNLSVEAGGFTVSLYRPDSRTSAVSDIFA